jgi:DNA modification methylase
MLSTYCQNAEEKKPVMLPVSQATPFYSTELGSAFLGDSLELLPKVATASIDLICTSPPFALLRQKQYGNVSSHEYVEWFMQFAREFRRILKPCGSLVIDIGGTWLRGVPVRSICSLATKPVSKDDNGIGGRTVCTV